MIFASLFFVGRLLSYIGPIEIGSETLTTVFLIQWTIAMCLAADKYDDGGAAIMFFLHPILIGMLIYLIAKIVTIEKNTTDINSEKTHLEKHSPTQSSIETEIQTTLENESAEDYPSSYKKTLEIFQMANSLLTGEKVSKEALIAEIDSLREILIEEGWMDDLIGSEEIIAYFESCCHSSLEFSEKEKGLLIILMQQKEQQSEQHDI